MTVFSLTAPPRDVSRSLYVQKERGKERGDEMRWGGKQTHIAREWVHHHPMRIAIPEVAPEGVVEGGRHEPLDELHARAVLRVCVCVCVSMCA